MTIYRLTEEDYTRILMFKRDLHMHPELSRKEVRTSAKIRDFLSTLPDFRILPLETETGTGVAAQIIGEPNKAEREAALTGVCESRQTGGGRKYDCASSDRDHASGRYRCASADRSV